MTLGINRAKTATLCALAEAGGTASTTHLVVTAKVGRQYLLRLLKELEDEGYVHGSPPVEERASGVSLTWTTDTAALTGALHRLAEAWTPKLG